MTHNVVAYFASSKWKNSESTRATSLGFNVGDLKEYRVVSGSVFNEEYSETLDSATLLLSQISKEDRLAYIKPYEYVRVVDKSDPTHFDTLYLVDNFNEQENNITEHIFGYTINLMSETKLLEKIQCPNLAITHGVQNGQIYKITIYDAIVHYLELYIPKAKMAYYDETSHKQKWKYDYIISWPGRSGEFFDKFNIPCADLSFNCPTLRQLLTTLMQQVGCIPVVKNRTLGFMDLQKKGQIFGGGDYAIGNTVNFINRSQSSDSYVNTLVNMSDQVLDSDNEVICEALGFRDRNSVLLKQEENLYLETKFPIYKVNEFIINAYVNVDLTISNVNWFKQNTAQNLGPDSQHQVEQWQVTPKIGANVLLYFDLVFDKNLRWDEISVRIHGKVYYFKYESAGYSFDIDDTIDGLSSISEQTSSYNRTVTENTYIKDVETNYLKPASVSIPSDFDKVYFSGTVTIINNISRQQVVFNVFSCNFSNQSDEPITNLAVLYSEDITKLLVEKSERQLLSTDFNKMKNNQDPSGVTWNPPTLDLLSKYIYGTVEYSIGSTRIEGFSDRYTDGSSTVLGWIDVTKTYIENIWNFITTNYQDYIILKIRNMLGGFDIVDDGAGIGNTNLKINSIAPFNPLLYVGAQTMIDWITEHGFAPGSILDTLLASFITNFNFSFLWFDLKYQPLNTFNLAYVKSIESVDYPLAQYDGTASGVTDFDRLSVHEQEQVDRVGNETLFIKQRTESVSDIQTFANGPLVFRDDTNRSGSVTEEDNGVDYVIFKRSFTIKNNCFDVNYVGAKDAVLKDYFTSIRTKYRAYQYVDYNQSVIRKERDTMYVKISDKGWYDGDNKVFFGEFTSRNADVSRQQKLLYQLFDNIKEQTNYAVLTGYNRNNIIESTKNDVSAIDSDNFFALVHEEADNVGSGTYLDFDLWKQGISNVEAMLGGVPQGWQIWRNDYYVGHAVSYVGNINIDKAFDDYIIVPEATLDDVANGQFSDFVSQLTDGFNQVLRMPVLSANFVDLFTNNVANTIFSIVDYNGDTIRDPSDTGGKWVKTFYKDYAETINYSVQFIYYTDSKYISWNKKMIYKMKQIFDQHSTGAEREKLIIVDISSENWPPQLNETEYETNPLSNIADLDSGVYGGDVVQFIFEDENHVTEVNPYFVMDWGYLDEGVNQVKLVLKTGGVNDHTYIDLMAFKEGEGNEYQEQHKFYVTLNDTKSDYVLDEDEHGVLYRKYKVQHFTDDGSTAGRYVEENYDE